MNLINNSFAAKRIPGKLNSSFSKNSRSFQEGSGLEQRNGKEKTIQNSRHYDGNIRLFLGKSDDKPRRSNDSPPIHAYDKSTTSTKRHLPYFLSRISHLPTLEQQYIEILETFKPRPFKEPIRSHFPREQTPDYRVNSRKTSFREPDWTQNSRDISFVHLLLDKTTRKSKSPLPSDKSSFVKNSVSSKRDSGYLEDALNSFRVIKLDNSAQLSYINPSPSRGRSLKSSQLAKIVDSPSHKRLPPVSLSSKNKSSRNESKRNFNSEALHSKEFERSLNNNMNYSVIHGSFKKRFSGSKRSSSNSKRNLYTEENVRLRTPSPDLVIKTSASFKSSGTPEPFANNSISPRPNFIDTNNNSMLIGKKFS